MRRFQRFGDLSRDGQQFGQRNGAGQRRPVDVLHHEIIGADVVQGTDVRMIQRGDGMSFPLEALAELLGADFDRYSAVKPRVPRLVDFTHATGANGCEDLVRAESGAYGEEHKVSWILHHNLRGFQYDSAIFRRYRRYPHPKCRRD